MVNFTDAVDVDKSVNEVPDLFASFWSLQNLAQVSDADVSNVWNEFCHDIDDPEYGTSQGYMLSVYQAEIGIDSLTSCKDIADLCFEYSYRGSKARQLCPKTCECHLPGATNPLTGPGISGCSSACNSHPAHVAALATAPCEEKSKEVMVQEQAWQQYAKYIEDAAFNWPKTAEFVLIDMIGLLLREGCAAAVQYRNTTMSPFGPLDLCAENPKMLPFKSLRFFCPLTCECRSGMLNCPLACNSSSAR